MATGDGSGIASALRAVLGQTEHSDAVRELVSRLGDAADAGGSSAGGARQPVRKTYPDITYLNFHALGISLQLEPPSTDTLASSKSKAAASSGSDHMSHVVTAIDIYNHNPAAQEGGPKPSRSEYAAFPSYPIGLDVFQPIKSQTQPSTSQPRAAAKDSAASSSAPEPTGSLDVFPTTSGADFVRALGEPSRKGGGEGPVGRGPAAWMEWTGTDSTSPHSPSTSTPEARTTPFDPASAGCGSQPMPLQLMVELGGAGSRGPRRWEADSAGASVWRVLTLSRPPAS